MSRRILVLILSAIAIPATAQTFGFSIRAPQACLPVGNAMYRLAAPGAQRRLHGADRSRRGRRRTSACIWPTTPDEADFVLVDDGEARAWLPRRGNPQRQDRRHRRARPGGRPHRRSGSRRLPASMCARMRSRRKAAAALLATAHFVTTRPRGTSFELMRRALTARQPSREGFAANPADLTTNRKPRRRKSGATKVRRRWLLSGPRSR